MRYADLLAEKRRKEAERIKAEQLSVTQQPVYQSYQPPKSNNQVAYVAEKALLGLTAAAEGLYDFTVGGVATLLGRKDVAEEVYKDDITGQYAQLIEDKYNPTKVAYGIGMVVETLANMAPSIAVNAILPGSGLATIGTQAAGRGVTEAYGKTGELGAKEYAYGILSGLSEVAIEKVSGGIGGLGKGWIDDVAKKVVKNSVVRGMVSEGLEEVASTALDPVIKRMTYDKNAPNATAKEYAVSFGLGAITSGILQGGQNITRNITTHRSVGNKIIKQNKTQEVIDKALMLNKGDAFNMAKTLKSRVEQNKEITPVAIGRLAMQYNADFAEVNIRDIQESENVSRKQAEKIYSESLIAENQNPILEKAVAEGKISRRTVKQIAEFAKSTKAEIEYINETSDIEGYYKDGKLHINVNRGDVAYKTAVHEQLHYLEKNSAEQYKQVKEAVLGLSESIPEIKSKIAEVRNTYKNAKINGKALNLSETEIDSEVVAKVATDLIKSPDMLNKAIKNNKTFVERITGFIKGLLERGKGLFSTTEQKQLERAYNALTEALKAEKAVSAENAQSENKYSLTETKVLTKMPEKPKMTTKQKISDAFTGFQIAFTNEWAGVEKVGKKLGVNDIDTKTHQIRAAINSAEQMISGDVQLDAKKNIVGKGLYKILEPILSKGDEHTKTFYTYLLHLHNIDRLKVAQQKYNNLYGENAYEEKLQALSDKVGEVEKRLNDIKNQNTKKYKNTVEMLERAKNNLEKHKYYNAVFYNSAEESKIIADKALKDNPDFQKVADELYKYQDNLLQYRVDTGLITQEFADELRKIYPHYVPTNRDTESQVGTGVVKGKSNIAIQKTIGRAEGSNLDILPIGTMIGQQTIKVIRAGAVNQTAKALYDGAVKNNDYTDIQTVSSKKLSKDQMENIDYDIDNQPKNNEITFYDNGKQVTIKVSKNIFRGFESVNSGFMPSIMDNVVAKGLKKLNTTFKKLVTSYNPAFTVRNAARDIQDAGINSKDFAALLKNFPTAVQEIAKNGKMWQIYRAMGGLTSSLFNVDEGFTGRQNAMGLTKAEGLILNKLLQKVENVNTVVEQLPRFAEFLASVEKGNSYERALLDSADVTVNFGRTGRITKVLNQTLMPFLNPAIQGTSKIIRNVTSARSAKAIASLVIKCVVLGIVPQLFNMLMYWNDEDYKNLNTRDKENNYIIKIGSKFIKIPKGRIVSVLAGATLRTGETLEGNKNSWDGYLKNVSQQISPVENLNRTILSPFKDVATNTTWYGGAIEGRQFENIEPKQRYDESTSEIAKAMGKVINYSPKKIHYLLDQYSGVIGDFILPATTKKAERDFISGNFVIDPKTQNKLSNDFYKLYDETQYAKNNGDKVAATKVRYLNKVKAAVSELYDQKREIENSDLPRAEKLAQSRAIQILINEAYKTAINDYELLSNAFTATQSIEDENMRYIEGIRLAYGSERALREYNKDTYEKASIITKSGINYDIYYNSYFTIKNIEADKDKDGNSISGSKKRKVLQHIAGLEITVNQKLLLIMANGYTIQDGEIKGYSGQRAKKTVAEYIAGLNISKEEKIALAEQCGFTVKNGKIVLTK